MAYQTSTASSPNDLLGQLATFAAANGWTMDTTSGTGGDPSGNQRVFNDGAGGVFAAIPQNALGEIHFQPCTAFINNSTNFYAHNGSPNSSGSAGTFPKCGGIPNGSSFTYHFFAPSSAPRYLHVVVRAASGVFTHLAFGTCLKYGTFAGGQYATALSWRSSASSQGAFMFHDGIHSSFATSWVRCDVAFGGASPTWFQEIGYAFGISTGAAGFRGFTMGLYAGGLIGLTQRTPLCPNFLKAEQSGAPGQTIMIGHTPDLRLVSLQGRNPDGETVTIGSDDWMIFPARQMGATPATGTTAYQFTGTAPNHVSNHAGYAYRKIT